MTDAARSRATASAAIDAIAQSWAVISRRRLSERARAGDGFGWSAPSVRRRRRPDLAADASFGTGWCAAPLHPGLRARGVPGDGGQYTHAALWPVMAFARPRPRRSRHGAACASAAGLRTRHRGSVARYAPSRMFVAADVYSNPAHVGRGGWTWYTGSASWMCVVIEELLGLPLKSRGCTSILYSAPFGHRYEAVVKTSTPNPHCR